MINLLPNETKKQFYAARSNTRLVNYILFLLIAIGFLSLACFTAFLYLNNIKTSINKSTSTTDQSIQYTSIMNQIKDTNDTLSTAKNSLGQQISYSNILMSIGLALPDGVRLSSLSLNNNNFGTPMILVFESRSINNRQAIIDSLSQLPIFSSFDIIATENKPNDTSGYSIIFNTNVVLSKVNN